MIKKIFKKIFKSNDVISFKQGFDLTELPVITLYQDNKKFNFLLDTGSNDCVIDKNILGQIDHEIVEKQTMLFGMDGITKKVNQCVIDLYYKDKKYPFSYIINDMKEAFDNIKKSTGVTLHGIIGSKFFAEYKYVLDFDELIAYSKK